MGGDGRREGELLNSYRKESEQVFVLFFKPKKRDINKLSQEIYKLERERFPAEGEPNGVFNWVSNQRRYKITFF